MAQPKSLTEAQVGLLRWVGDGCPPGHEPAGQYRISAAALARRGLIVVAATRASWTATLTKAGRAYLAEVDGPAPPSARSGPVSVTEQLIHDLVALESRGVV